MGFYNFKIVFFSLVLRHKSLVNNFQFLHVYSHVCSCIICFMCGTCHRVSFGTVVL